MKGFFQLTINGEPHRIEGHSITGTLMDYLRDKGLTGVKDGCAEGGCGACAVIVLDRDATGNAIFRSMNSCLTPLPMLADHEIVTVEGLLEDGKRHPVQEALANHFGSQCGFCTSGAVIALFEGYYRNDLVHDAQIESQLCGNLCRCTGYRPLRDAAGACFAVARNDDDETEARPTDRFSETLQSAAPSVPACEYVDAFDGRFLRPLTITELLRMRAQYPDARLVAGGTKVGLEIAKDFERYRCLLSLEAIADLKAIVRHNGYWEIGSAVTLTQFGEGLEGEYPAIDRMLTRMGSRQTRNRSTLGGNVVTAACARELAPVLIALEAAIRMASPEEEREVPVDQFFPATGDTILREDEVVKDVRIPRYVRAQTITRGIVARLCQSYKVSKRACGDEGIVVACFAVELDGAKEIKRARLAYGGVAPGPARARKTEEFLIGKPWSPETVTGARKVLEGEFEPPEDELASAGYRRGLVADLFEKFYSEFASGEETPVPLGAEAEFREAARLSAAGEESRGDDGVSHESMHKHLTGESRFVDDRRPRAGMLEVWPVTSPHAFATITRRDVSRAREAEGVRAVLLPEDVPGMNNVGAMRDDEPLIAEEQVFFHGQVVAIVVGETVEACRRAADLVEVDYQVAPPVLTIDGAIAASSFHTEEQVIESGSCTVALASASMRLEGKVTCGGQEHFYLETQVAWAEALEDGAVRLDVSSQHPSQLQSLVADVLGTSKSQVHVQCHRMGGAFGGKETQAHTWAAIAAVAARVTGAPVRVRLNRAQDMALTGKRHPFRAEFTVGYDEEGRILGVKISLFANGGWSLDLSDAVMERALLHLDNAYAIPHVRFSGRVCKTNLVSNTACRASGPAEAMLVMEEILSRVARELGLPAEQVRRLNAYGRNGNLSSTPYGQEVDSAIMARLWDALVKSSDFEKRRAAVDAWNREHPEVKRGLAITPVKLGTGFSISALNQAGALVNIFSDGSIQVNHSGAESGQGIHTKMGLIAAESLGVDAGLIRVMDPSTGLVPNTPATAVSSGCHLNGEAVRDACATLVARMRPVAAQLLHDHGAPIGEPAEVVFRDGAAWFFAVPDVRVDFRDVVFHCWRSRMSLSATGFFRTPGLSFDREKGKGNPFASFVFGAAVSEVEVDGFTGDRLLRSDVLQETGDSKTPEIDRCQVEGGFVQGTGWLTCEELLWNSEGVLWTDSAARYKIPTLGEVPIDFRVRLWSAGGELDAGPRGRERGEGGRDLEEVGVPLALSVREAINDAVAAFGSTADLVDLCAPATPESVYRAIEARHGGGGQGTGEGALPEEAAEAGEQESSDVNAPTAG